MASRIRSDKSHLLQMRGLKQYLCEIIGVKLLSHLLQMRGLKQPEQPTGVFEIMSHLLQMRGLKLSHDTISYQCPSVASFTDAWIET